MLADADHHADLSSADACRSLWAAVLLRYFQDVRAPASDKGEALADFTGEQRTLKALAQLAGYDADRVARLTLADIRGANIKR